MSIFKTYLKQPSTWLGIAKIGTAAGIYSTGLGGAISTVVIAIFGLIDVIRNEASKPQL
ncbi:hypothetical protein UFOVP298_28 [uncultured Caudovirales phage]|uniref:Uncharacterized protein n=1 Tax=uncultured Caudovirales phage TaxID=2100421 RepID=A0A6J5LPC6_9CAUD|nr:hypothetical protein UFOVP298_28 [uncultured Caudovirales phage]CAB4150650.1 hypothetical protein UFOVP572_11 [uncultured Caudovirales phage]